MTLVKVCTVDELRDGKSKCVSQKGKEFAVFNVKGKYFCVNNSCTHLGGPLCEGNLSGKVITCPWHGAQFDVTTGKVLSGPAGENVQTHVVVIQGRTIFIDV